MNKKVAILKIKDGLKKVDWRLLLFLTLLINVKLVIKLFALLLIYVLRPGFSFGFSWKNARLPLFYFFIPVFAVISSILNMPDNIDKYLPVMALGLVFWISCLLAAHQVKKAAEVNSGETLFNTITFFFIMNAAVSLVTYLGIMIDAGTLNPFTYQGEFQKYFMGTGDHIRGISFDTSDTNALISAFGILYFLHHSKYGMAVLNMLVLLLTGSNITIIATSGILCAVFLFNSIRAAKSVIIISIAMSVVFFAKVSPHNTEYVTSFIERVTGRPESENTVNTPIKNETDTRRLTAQLYLDSLVLLRQKSAAAKPDSFGMRIKNERELKRLIIHTPGFQHKNDTSVFKRKLLEFTAENKDLMPLCSGPEIKSSLPGKLLAAKEVVNYFRDHPQNTIFGAGPGNFSSKLAFRATALDITGGYPAGYSYINPAFLSNHLDLYLSYFTRHDEKHSVVNSPASAYYQLMAEYGIAGMLCFVIGYVYFFFKHIKKSITAHVLLFMLLFFFLFEYWFEQLSVVIVFELLVYSLLKNNSNNKY